MFQHEPQGYQCPFCRVLDGDDLGPSGSVPGDIVYRDDKVAALIASKWWRNTKGHVLVLPTQHHENIFDLPAALGSEIQRVAQGIAIAMKHAYACDGISTRQHNEPAGNQSVWHYHLHVYPRYRHDFLNLTWGRHTTAEQRLPYAEKLRQSIRDLHLLAE
jgi:histidine triad (HIT) family protein